MFDTVLCRYGEIALKGNNRGLFENQLVKNIRYYLKKYNVNFDKIIKVSGRIIIKTKDDCKCLGNVFGLVSYSKAIETELDLDKIKNIALMLYKKGSFRISANRITKTFLDSQKINEEVGEFILKEKKAKVNLSKPDVDIRIEIINNKAYIFNEKVKCLGGLPVGVTGTVLSSLSGGIDSPIAAYLMMKRGCEVIFVHMHNQTLTDKNTKEKLNLIVKELSKFQIKSKLYIVPFAELQKKIITYVHSELRMIIYRRLMLKILNKIAKNIKAKAIVTGDSVGQVASQTLDNLNSIYNASKILVLSPLSGMDKDEIVNIARKIGTYGLSIIPYPDCCSFMIAKHPEIRSKLENIKKIEKNIVGLNKLIKDTIKNSEIIII